MKQSLRFIAFAAVFLSVCQALPAGGAAPRQPAAGTSLRGFARAGVAGEISAEEKMRAVPDASHLREYMHVLASRPHYVGSPYDRENAEYIRDRFRSFGLTADIEEFEVLFPTPEERVLEMTGPVQYRAKLEEPAVPGDPTSGGRDQLPGYNVFSADGDVTGELVYVNYGLPSDYEELARMGVSVKDRIVLVRYGAAWRGLKPKLAYEHGAAGCIIYSDPRDDGYYQGDVYPEGPFRPRDGVQRGSVMDMPVRPGDPLTPGWASTKDARRIPREQSDVIMKIPVLPISYGDAMPLLKALTGRVAPEPWRGALPLTYHVGPGPARVHLKLRFNWAIKPVYDVIARIEGSLYPDQWVIAGNHHDAWVYGASDPVSGVISIMETGRAFGRMLAEGWKPKRTILLCAWDGEEAALLGSTEWAEAHAAELNEKAVAYINSDSNGRGWISLGGSHTLEKLADEVTRDIRDPRRGQSVWQALRDHSLNEARSDREKQAILRRNTLSIAALGSGSDFTPFLQHLGIASLNAGFDGEDDSGVYHSIYDSITWFERFSDTDYEYCRALSEFHGTMIMRLADSDVLPFEFTALAEVLGRYENEIETLDRKGAPSIDFEPLRSAIASLTTSARKYEDTLAAADPGSIPNLKELNETLFRSERKMTIEQGLPRRPWFRHVVYAPGLYTGYAVKTLPGVRESLEQKNWQETRPQIEAAGNAIRALAAEVDRAAALAARGCRTAGGK